eukprot:5801415-Pleurochrysis_carterae.AAC.1
MAGRGKGAHEQGCVHALKDREHSRAAVPKRPRQEGSDERAVLYRRLSRSATSHFTAGCPFSVERSERALLARAAARPSSSTWRAGRPARRKGSRALLQALLSKACSACKGLVSLKRSSEEVCSRKTIRMAIALKKPASVGGCLHKRLLLPLSTHIA